MIIAVDFDGTCVTHGYPKVGKDIGAAKVLKKLVASGHQLILWTMRSDDFMGDKTKFNFSSGLEDAIKWFEVNEIPLYGIQRNPSQDEWTSSPKAYAQLYIDDAALGCPLTFDESISDRPFVNWEIIQEYLIKGGIITI